VLHAANYRGTCQFPKKCVFKKTNSRGRSILAMFISTEMLQEMNCPIIVLNP
jgi:hypothetical protein